MERERNARKEWEGCICLSEFLSVEGGEWEGLSIIPNHLYSAVHITSPRWGVGESRLICIGPNNCWKAVRPNKIYGWIDVYIWCFCSVWRAEDKCVSAICWCAEGCNLTAVYQKQVFFENLLHRFGCMSQLLYSCPLMPQTEFFIVMFEAFQNRWLKICPVDF